MSTPSFEEIKTEFRNLIFADSPEFQENAHGFFSPRGLFLFALFSGIAISLVSLFCTQDIYRDCAHVYAYYARELAEYGLAAGWVGRVPMLHILLSGCLAKTGIDAYSATILVSSAFYVFTLFPLRRLLERYLSPIWAAWGCVLFIYAVPFMKFRVYSQFL